MSDSHRTLKSMVCVPWLEAFTLGRPDAAGVQQRSYFGDCSCKILKNLPGPGVCENGKGMRVKEEHLQSSEEHKSLLAFLDAESRWAQRHWRVRSRDRKVGRGDLFDQIIPDRAVV